MLVAAATLCACSSQGGVEFVQATEPPPIGEGKESSKAREVSASDDDLDAGMTDEAESRISTRERALDASVNSRGDASEGKPAEDPEKTDADARAPEMPEVEDATPRDAGAAASDEPMIDAECTRARLREKAETFLQSITSGDTTSLRVHAGFRYTENGRDEQLGGGAWQRRGESLFARHVLDDTRCSTLTQAVMSGISGRFAFGVRLRYREGLLLEAEAQVVPELLAATNLDALIPTGDDPWVAEVPEAMRASREELIALAQRYFDSVTDASSLPASAPGCRRLQNGAPLGDGTCTEPPGTARFQQQRFDLADVPSGIVTATVLYDDHVGFYLIKVADNLMQNIEVVGGATTQATGW